MCIRDSFERSLWGGTLDLSSAYHHVEIHPESTTYLGFEWGGVFHRFVVLPFGISTAPWLFTKVHHPLPSRFAFGRSLPLGVSRADRLCGRR